MKIKWLRLALEDINEIADFISQENLKAAYDLVKLIWDKSKLLSDHPDIGRPGRVSGTRELYIKGTRCIIPYRVRNDHIEILRVLHTSRKWPNKFK